jgi:hypothetical protein|tara:strand:+ start:1226 stop:1375 length:150 start_codon:yes stop_codon:yes gene_type:complete
MKIWCDTPTFAQIIGNSEIDFKLFHPTTKSIKNGQWLRFENLKWSNDGG